MFRTGILLGLVFAIVGIIVFGKMLTSGVNPQKGQMVVISMQPFVYRFLSGLFIGAAVPLALIAGIRYAVVVHAVKHLAK